MAGINLGNMQHDLNAPVMWDLDSLSQTLGGTTQYATMDIVGYHEHQLRAHINVLMISVVMPAATHGMHA
jgi:hypothetical protein